MSIIKGVEGSYSSELAQSVSEKIIEVRQDQEMGVSYMTLDELIQDERDEALTVSISELPPAKERRSFFLVKSMIS